MAKLDGDRRLVMLIEPLQLLGSGELDALGRDTNDADAAPTAQLPLARAA